MPVAVSFTQPLLLSCSISLSTMLLFVLTLLSYWHTQHPSAHRAANEYYQFFRIKACQDSVKCFRLLPVVTVDGSTNRTEWWLSDLNLCW